MDFRNYVNVRFGLLIQPVDVHISTRNSGQLLIVTLVTGLKPQFLLDEGQQGF
jgi:hypothetical protein